MFDGQLFTTNHANFNSQEHNEAIERTHWTSQGLPCVLVYFYCVLFFLHLLHQLMEKFFTPG